MIITINPSDIIKRCLWANYKKFILKDYSEKEIEKIVEEDKPFSLSEEDAYVIGLLKVVETDNLIHRFKEYINEKIDRKSTIHKIDNERNVLINKSSIKNDCLNFKNNFPEYFNDKEINDEIKKVNEYINKKIKELDNLNIIEITKNINNQSKNIPYLKSKEVNKMFKLNIIE